MRFAILGNSGSGKSTLAKDLAKRHSLSLLDLDTVAWVPGTVGVPRDPEEASGDVRRFCQAHDSFVIEGCYEKLVAVSFEFSPKLIYLDPGADVCIQHCRARPFEPHKYESPEAQHAKLEFLLAWVRDHYTREGPMSHVEHMNVYGAYAGPKVRYDRDSMLI